MSSFEASATSSSQAPAASSFEASAAPSFEASATSSSQASAASSFEASATSNSHSQHDNNRRKQKKLLAKIAQRTQGPLSARFTPQGATNRVASNHVSTINLPWRSDLASYMKDKSFSPDSKIFDNFTRIGGKGSGYVYVLDELTKELVFACCITEFQDMNHDLHQDFSRVFKYFHEDKKFNSPETSNGAHRGGGGKMRCLGWRTQYRADEAFGHYVPEDKIRNPTRCAEWLQHTSGESIYMEYMLIAFYRLAPGILQSQQAQFKELGVPGLGDMYHEDNDNSEYPFLYCSNLAYTCDGFVNKAHRDQDVSTYTHGISAFVDTTTGQMASSDYALLIDYSKINGVVEQIWQGPHHIHATVEGTVADGYTRYGSSTQINKRLSDAVKKYRSGQLEGKHVRGVDVLIDQYFEEEEE
ncbi:hypothetical protein EDC01DRAFT_631210 [Geopyxis carbonaria]|nr:hypothetical protein EDC01DRAFT_631210 [Geopyxis carbonaria]